ncbi:MAG: GNAT family N-acetyltransferase [Patescibacteria group bacterium]|nr:GNAT family N-acetyltransferase [Patescibacteria group bacterium]
MKIRKAEEGEIGEIAKIIREEIYPEISVTEMEEWIKGLGWPPNPYLWWFVVEKGGEIIGCMRWAIWDFCKDEILLLSSWIGIKKEYQNQGIGKELWREAFNRVKQYWQEKGKKIAAIFTETDEDNKRACHFYRKLFEQPKEIKLPMWSKERIVWFFKNF